MNQCWWKFTQLQCTIWGCAWRRIITVLTISREIISSVEMGEYFHDFFYHSLVVCRCEFFNYQVNFHIFHIVLVFYVRNRWLLKTTTFMKEFDRVCCFCFKIFSLLNCSNSLLLVVNVVLILGIKNFSEQYFSLVCFLSVCEKCFCCEWYVMWCVMWPYYDKELR